MMIYNTIGNLIEEIHTRNVIKYKLTINYTYFNMRKKRKIRFAE